MTAQVATEHERKMTQSSLGMYVAIISWTMLFATLFLGYAIFRFTAVSWPPMGIHIPLKLPSISTLVIAFSSLSLYFYQEARERQRPKKALISYMLTLFLGAFFIYCQFQLWAQLKELGIYASSGIFPSLVYTFTWIHTAHMALAYLALLWPMVATIKELRNREGQQKLKDITLMNICTFWHFLGIIWLIIYLFVFVL